MSMYLVVADDVAGVAWQWYPQYKYILGDINSSTSNDSSQSSLDVQCDIYTTNITVYGSGVWMYKLWMLSIYW